MYVYIEYIVGILYVHMALYSPITFERCTEFAAVHLRRSSSFSSLRDLIGARQRQRRQWNKMWRSIPYQDMPFRARNASKR